MILEGIVTTSNPKGQPHAAPMGPDVDETMHTFRLRPFQTSHTFAHLMARPQGVLHVVDDVELLAQAAIGRFDPQRWRIVRATGFDGWLLTDACRWYAFEVVSVDLHGPRAEMQCRVVDRGTFREFFGLNRAMHAVVEAAILATRLHCMVHSDVVDQLERLRPLVEKTGGAREHRAFALIEQFVRAETEKDAGCEPVNHGQGESAEGDGIPHVYDKTEPGTATVRPTLPESVVAAATSEVANSVPSGRKRPALDSEPRHTP